MESGRNLRACRETFSETRRSVAKTLRRWSTAAGKAHGKWGQSAAKHMGAGCTCSPQLTNRVDEWIHAQEVNSAKPRARHSG
jgi:hypothetical protein